MSSDFTCVSADCQDLTSIGPSERVEYKETRGNSGRVFRVAIVLQDTVADTDTIYVAGYDPFCYFQRTDTSAYYSSSYECFIVKSFQSYEELKNNNHLYPWRNITYMNVGCALYSVRIVNGTLYCRENSKFNDDFEDRLVKADLRTGAVIYDRMLYGADKSSDTLGTCCPSHDLFVDETGMWLLYNGKNGGNAVLELLDPHDLSAIYKKTLPFQTGNGYSQYPTRYFMMCGKLYAMRNDSIQAWDTSNANNTFNYKAKVNPNLVGGHYWPHYNPRLKQLFLCMVTENSRFNVSTCSSRFPISPDFSLINSTFLWSITPTSLTDTGHYTKLVEELERYANIANVDVQINASNLITTCPAEFCLNPENRTSLFCRIKTCATTLRVMADYKKTLTGKRKILQTGFHMQQILEQNVLRAIALKISELRHFTSMGFEELKTAISKIKNDLGNYFNKLAKYDEQKAQADVDFIYGKLEAYKKSLNESTQTLERKLLSMFHGAIGTVTAELAALAAKVVHSIVNAVGAVPPGSGVMDVLDAIDKLAVTGVNAAKLAFLKDNVLPLINETCSEMWTAINKTAVFHESVKNMIYAAQNKTLTNKNLESYYMDFLKEYNNYNPGLNGTMITKFSSAVNQAIDRLCELIFSGTHAVSSVGMYVFATRGDCFYTKVDVDVMVAVYGKYNEFQYDLLEAMASFVRAKVAETSSKSLLGVATELDKGQQERNLLKMRIHSLEIYIQSEMHIRMVIHEACSLIEYKSGGAMPDYCKRLIQNPHSTEYDKLVAYPYGTDMCSVDQIVKYVRIPAAFPKIDSPVVTGTIDLASLYAGNITFFKIPDQQWLVKNNWVSQHDANDKWFVKRFELFLPYDSSSTLKVHVTKAMTGENVITPGGTVYDFTTPVQFDFRYEENAASCYNTLVDHPYQAPGCANRQKICVNSRGWNQPTAFHASVYSLWGLQLKVDVGTLKPVKPIGDFYLKAGVILCKVKTVARRVSDQVNGLKSSARTVCCADSDKFFDQKLGACNNCPSQGCVKLNGYFCGNCTYAWP